jgi:hypothetical protein
MLFNPMFQCEKYSMAIWLWSTNQNALQQDVTRR